MTDAIAHRLERLVRELDDVRLSMLRADALRLEVLIDRLTGAER
jgi:hypothetical protein